MPYVSMVKAFTQRGPTVQVSWPWPAWQDAVPMEAPSFACAAVEELLVPPPMLGPTQEGAYIFFKVDGR